MAFGEGPLSQPLLVEAIEDLFEPVLIHNNAEGYDEQILERFLERAWNNPVVRYLDAAGDDLIPRAEEIWTTAQVTARTVLALRAAGRPVPPWLALLDEELNPTQPETPNPDQDEQDEQERKAPASEPLHRLRRSPLRLLPLTPMQARRVDAALTADGDPSAHLSPRQSLLRTRILRALRIDGQALQGMTRPEHIEELPGYQATLERVLTKLERGLEPRLKRKLDQQRRR